MSQGQSLGIGGLSYKATADLSGLVTDVTGGNAIGTTYKNGIGMAVIADASNANQVVIAGGNAVILGVLMNNPKAGEPAAIQSVRGSSCKVVVGAITSIVPNAKLITDSNGAFKGGASEIPPRIAKLAMGWGMKDSGRETPHSAVM